MRRNGSIIGTLAVALVATVGVVGGGYTILTGNSICSLAGACDTSTEVTQVAQNEKASTCSKSKAINVADKSACSKTGVKTVAAADAGDCASKASTCSKTTAVADKSSCSKSGVKTVAAADAGACASKASTCSKTTAVADKSSCSESGVKTVAAADASDCASKASTCSKTTAVADASACSTKASECSTDGAKAVAVASYSCNAESMLSDDQMAARAELHNSLMPKIKAVRELENGYAIDFPACSSTLVEVAEMVAMSRECCDFMDYKIVADSKGGAVHLVMTGDAGAKAFLAKAMGPMVTEVADTGSCDACPSKGAKAMNASNADDCNACPTKGAKAVNASNAMDCNACPSKSGKVVATKIDINDACCEKGVKAVKAGKAMPECCDEKTDAE